MNPFEIRAQMLSMAQEYLQQQQEINLDFAGRTFEQLVKEGKKVAKAKLLATLIAKEKSSAPAAAKKAPAAPAKPKAKPRARTPRAKK
jgi:pyruvate/2-oxoglutarate dehydrogenase complex dihydrolipoamide acyltransferase (E2) component